DTPEAVRLFTGSSLAATPGLAAANPLEFQLESRPVTQRVPDLGDGDSTITLHGALGLTLRSDDRVYLVSDPQHSKHGPLAESSPQVHDLIRRLIDGTISGITHPEVSARYGSFFHAPGVGLLHPDQTPTGPSRLPGGDEAA